MKYKNIKMSEPKPIEQHPFAPKELYGRLWFRDVFYEVVKEPNVAVLGDPDYDKMCVFFSSKENAEKFLDLFEVKDQSHSDHS